MGSMWVMPAVALVSCVIIGLGFFAGIPGDKD
ncbi:hypothetical protein Gbro_2913 [Gordonia bronchialis DSM 43247]|uniref:Uncharacterized protein n=1 Tax=Gordonia bronchialis (strain ATCC 25592 / DSM 43247 / BCRC 13721 / JCM 3198 / KCTC 3076 / NBRC 16047 / NCTC 10667) TaxID=526226 RepID=D0L9V8_GORB4|nr:hypothetical protein Gbro_2913 [Gordonia bronchialis DSM 43247]STQ65043.1 Uncharacterised protein [Gordonia bronchialis]